MARSGILGAALWLAAMASPALALDVFDISGVRVDVTAENAAAARTQALAEGQRKAYEMMLKRLTLRADWPRLPSPSAQTVEALVRDFSVIEEKTSSVRYIAALAYRFKPGEVRALLINSDIPFAETPSKPVLVLPVLKDGSSFLLWEEPNPWRAAWERRPLVIGLVPTLLPLGDLADVAAISADQALAGDAARLRALAQRYGASDAMVAFGTLTSSGGSPALQVSLNRYGDILAYPTRISAFNANPGESVEDMMARVANEVTLQIEDDWKKENIVRHGAASLLPVVVPLNSLAEWLAVRDRLGGVALVGGMEGIVLSRDQARLNLRFSGTLDQLQTAMAQADLRLSRGEGDTWLIVPSQAAAAGR